MTAPQAGGAGRSSTGSARSSAGTAVPALLVLLLLGLLLRLTIAYLLLPGSGFSSDIGTFAAWANRLADVGPGAFYAPDYFVDYPPGYMYVLWLVGIVGKTLSVAGGTSALIKLPPMLADIGVAFVLFHIVRGWLRGAVSEQWAARANRLGLTAAAIYLFNPVTWYDSAVWGQTDAVGALVIVLGLAALIRGNSEGAFAMAVLAALVKPQFGVVFAPLVLVVLLKRHLLSPGSGPQNRPWVPAFARTWFEDERGVWRLVSSATVGMVIVLVLITPFALDLPGLLTIFAKAAGGYEFLTINAYNGWALLGSNGSPGIAFGGAWSWSPDTVPLFGPIPGVIVGAVLLVGGFLIALARAAWRDDRRSLLVVAAFMAMCFFMLPTRVHERYLFPVFAILPILAVLSRRWLVITVLLAIASFINLHGVLTTEIYATDNLKGLPLGDFCRSTPGVLLSVALHLTAFVMIALELRPKAAEEPELGSEPILDEVAGEQGWIGAPEGGGLPVPAMATEPTGRWLDGARDFLRPVWSVVPLRRDRSAELVNEGPGRLDRLDLLLLVVVFLAALGLRTIRVEQPHGMHFDEVYHARTATEFLQFGRYGIEHGIYEYTHPHMAKYLIGQGIELFGNNRVVDERDLSTTVKTALIEQRWAPSGQDATTRDGDRVYVLTATDIRVYDLLTKVQVATVNLSAAGAAIDDTNHVLYLATAEGSLLSVATDQFDLIRADSGASPAAPREVAAQPAGQLVAIDGGVKSLTFASNRLVAITDAGQVIAIDPQTFAETGRTQVAGASDAAIVNSGQRLVVDMSQVTNVEMVLSNLATFAGGDITQFRAQVAGRAGRVVLQAYLGDSDLAEKITNSGLTGAIVEAGQPLAVGGTAGVTFVDAETLDQLLSLPTEAPVTGFAYVDKGADKPTLYSAAGSSVELIRVPNDAKPTSGERMAMPGPVSDVLFNPSTVLVHVLGRTPDRTASTIYVIEPHANAVFADARLSFTPRAVVMDAQPQRPADDRNDILAYSDEGTVATVDVGNNAFGWRFMGVIAGALMAACLYLLARFLFRRRSVAVFAGLLILLDGMAFANARIAMNDTYVAFFIVAALTLFAPLYMGRWRSPVAVGAAIVGVGVLLGLALASKWVGAYALGGVLLLILLRSALGRVIALLGMISLTAVLGYIGIQADGATPPTTAGANYTFLIMMVLLTALLAVAMALRPVRLSKDEYRLCVFGPLVAGGLVAMAGAAFMAMGANAPAIVESPIRLVVVGSILIFVGLLAYVVMRVAAGFGVGPLVPPAVVEPGEEPPSAPPAQAWLRPGGGPLGMAWLVALGSLVLIPLLIYVASYKPWVDMNGRWTEETPAGHTGQTFIQLQVSMYDYHNNLRATHPASSPWWAWPLDLKPVWFEQGSYAAGTASSIYNSGNVVIFWLAIPAFAFACWQAWRRRSLALTFVALMVLSLWLPWVRIDRATFQYHFFTTLPFSILGLAYFLAELWHGPSPRTWLLARVSAALAILGPVLLWIIRQPLCGLAGTQRVAPNSEACGATTRQLALTDLQAAALVTATVGLIALAWLLWLAPRDGRIEQYRRLALPLLLVAILGGLTLVLVGAVIPGPQVFAIGVGLLEFPLLFLLLAILAVPAYYVLRARDARRFAASAVLVAALWFVIWYPNFSGLPVPSAVLNLVNNILSPTYNWGFQFAVNTATPANRPLEWAMIVAFAVVLLVLVAAAFYAARSWRIQRADEQTLRALDAQGTG